MLNCQDLGRIGALAILVCTVGGVSGSVAAQEPARLLVPDGQLRSHPLRVFATTTLTLADRPVLRLVGVAPAFGSTIRQSDSIAPMLVAPGQQWTSEVAGQQVQVEGTLLLFDLSAYAIPPYKAMTRVMPTLAWGANRLSAEHAVYLGYFPGVLLWTGVMLIVALTSIVVLARRANGRAARLLLGPSGRLSLSLTQAAAWTIAVGAVVFAYGLIRLDIPEIPPSLVVLMGLSLATGGISYLKSPAGATGKDDGEWDWSDLVRDTDPGAKGKPSFARAQMVFWTVVSLALFLTKSILDGVIWQVPWALVGLMGLSQTGYLAPKFSTPSTPDVPPVG